VLSSLELCLHAWLLVVLLARAHLEQGAHALFSTKRHAPRSCKVLDSVSGRPGGMLWHAGVSTRTWLMTPSNHPGDHNNQKHKQERKLKHLPPSKTAANCQQV
jgi:hypothetical protein